MNSLKARLHLVEEEFLAALAKGGDALPAFDERWETLIHDIDNAMEVSGLDTETATLAHTVAYRMSVLADTCTDLAKSYDTFTSQLMDEIAILMDDLAVVDSGRVDVSTSIPDSTIPSISSSSSLSISNHRSPSSRKRSREDDIPPSRHQPTKKQRVPYICDAIPLSRNNLPFTSPSVSSMPLPASADSPPQTERRPNRKRRLSDADLVVSCHKAKRVHVGPRLHAVSDSFTTFHPSTSSSKQSGRAAATLPPLPRDSSPLFIQPLVPSSLNEEAIFFNPNEEFGLATLSELASIGGFCSPTKCTARTEGGSTDPVVGSTDTTDQSNALDWPECVFATSPALSSDSSSSPSPTTSCPATPPLCAGADSPLPPYSLGPPLFEAFPESKDILLPITLLPDETLPPCLDALQSSLTLDPFFDPLDPSVWLCAPPPYSHWPQLENVLPPTKISCHSMAGGGLQVDSSESWLSAAPLIL